MPTARFIRQLREQAGLTQRQLATVIDVEDARLSEWERAIVRPERRLEELASCLGVTTDEILRGERATDHASGETKLQDEALRKLLDDDDLRTLAPKDRRALAMLLADKPIDRREAKMLVGMIHVLTKKN